MKLLGSGTRGLHVKVLDTHTKSGLRTEHGRVIVGRWPTSRNPRSGSMRCGSSNGPSACPSSLQSRAIASFDTLTRLKRAHAQVAAVVENVTDDVFRMLNVPAGSDVRKLREQVSRMERRLEAMSKELAKQNDPPRGKGTQAMTEERADQKNASPGDATKAMPKERASRKTVPPGDGMKAMPKERPNQRPYRRATGRRDPCHH